MEKINKEDIVFGIVRIKDGYQTIMSGPHGDRQLMEEIGSQLCLVALQHRPFEEMLKVVVKAITEEREALLKELDKFDINKQVSQG